MTHKYGAKAVTVDGHRFASQAEARRYGELRTLERTGEISLLALQPRFTLFDVGGVKVEYVADFSYLQDGLGIVEDVKGARTAVYAMKIRMFLALLGRQWEFYEIHNGKRERVISGQRRKRKPRTRVVGDGAMSRVYPKSTWGRLTVIEMAAINEHRHTVWLCVCVCGAQVEVTETNLGSGHTRSRGCLAAEQHAARSALWKKTQGRKAA